MLDQLTKRILILGGMGALGQPVVRRLISDGFTVRLLSREPFNTRMHFGGTIISNEGEMAMDAIEIIEGDCRRAFDVSTALTGCSGLHVSVKVSEGADSLQALESRTALAVAEAVKGRGLDLVTYTSCSFVNEEFTDNFIVKCKLDAEQIYIDNDAPWMVLRVAQPMEYLREFNQFGVGIKFGEMGQAHHWIASSDYAAVVARAHRGEFDPNQVLYPKGPEPYTFDRAMGTYLLNVHNRANMIKLPRGVLSVAKKLFPRPHLQYYEAMMQLLNDAPEGSHRIKGHDEQVRGRTTLMQWCAQQSELRQ
ncbi:SDR family oxidoreductase [bacterium]|nr:SDR family oxidoreductase [bacterium]MCB1219525.1 SDR family oxidoreductase [bacterium]UNM08877.1 MAG: SDR family oxidoreductase [Planctomycetales bacterium]